MNIQKTSWGEIRWFDEETKVRENRRLQVGEVYLRGRGHQAKHLHHDEQVMYCISGEAVSAVNGETSILKPGDCLHYPAGIEHEVWAYTEEPFVHLLISNPMQVGNDVFFASDRKERIDPKLLYIAVEAVRNQFLESLNYTFVIFDSMGNLVFQSNRFPDYCVRRCNPGDRQGNCPCMRQLSLEQCQEQRNFTCPYKMEVLLNPIIFQGHFMGYIQGGFFRHSGETGEEENIYDVPESVVVGVGALLRRIVKAIRNYCEFEQFRRELDQKEMQIASETKKQSMILTDLRRAQKEVTDLKINNHFLFNTLNQMASMAVEGGQMELYQSIVNLSKMFRYTLRTQSQMVSLEKELEYVEAYLQLQRLRYQDHLSYFESTNVCPLKIVGHAYNGAEALDMIRREKPNLVFMDINMPFIDGFEVIEKMEDCKVIIITAYDSFAYAQRALRLGACDILAKPIDLEQLRSAVERAVGHQYTENQWLNQVLSYIYEHYMEQVGYQNMNQFYKYFAREMNMTPAAYLKKH